MIIHSALSAGGLLFSDF